MILQGITVPAKTEIVILTFMIHRDKNVYPDPHAFDPERFCLAKGGVRQHPYSFIPFSAGPRNCIGQKFAMMEMKTLLSSMLRKFQLTTDVSREDFDAALLHEIVLRPGDGVKVKITRRQ